MTTNLKIAAYFETADGRKALLSNHGPPNRPYLFTGNFNIFLKPLKGVFWRRAQNLKLDEFSSYEIL